MKRYLRVKQSWLLWLLPLSFILYVISSKSSWFAEEVMAKRVSRGFAIIISNVTALVPFSVAELLLIVGPLVITIFMVRLILHMVRDCKNLKVILKKGAINFLSGISILAFLYVVGAGVNYYRYPFSYYSG